MNNVYKHLSTSNNSVVTNQIRELAKADLRKSIVMSNRLLLKQYKVPGLKNASEITELSQNTENTIYMCHHDELTKYLETVLTFIVFLTDPLLSEDACLFRYLINLEMTDLYIEPNCAELLFSELLYSDINPYAKCQIFTQITKEISDRIYNIHYEYTSGQPYTSTEPIIYNIQPKLKHKINQYRKDQLQLINPDIVLAAAPPDNSEYDSSDSEKSTVFDDSESDIDNVIIPDSSRSLVDIIRLIKKNPVKPKSRSLSVEVKHVRSTSRSLSRSPSMESRSHSKSPSNSRSRSVSPVHSRSPSVESRSASPAVASESRSQSKSPSHSRSRSVSPVHSRSPSVVSKDHSRSQYDSLSDSEFSSRSDGTMSEDDSGDFISVNEVPAISDIMSEMSDEGSDISFGSNANGEIVCDYCKSKPFKHSYKTPLLGKNGVIWKYFCGFQCMEKWEDF